MDYIEVMLVLELQNKGYKVVGFLFIFFFFFFANITVMYLY